MEKDIEIICKYKYLSTEFLISLINKEELLFSKIEDGKINNKLTIKELYIATQILDSLVVNEDCSVFIRKIKVGKNIYKLYFDKKTRIYWWIGEGGQVSKEDNIYLNKKYNDMHKVIYLDENSDNDQNIGNIVRRIIIGYVLVPILAASSSVTISHLAFQKVQEYKISKEIIECLDDPEIKTYKNLKELLKEENKESLKEEEYREEIEKNNEYSWEKIKNAIESNENLTRRRKRISI